MKTLIRKIFPKKNKVENVITKQTSAFDLLSFPAQISAIPGMLDDESGKCLFLLASGQSLQGDIVEIGSWQGKSTSYLAKSVEITGNGKVYAIDHFKGNVGKESFYKVGKDDLSDLKTLFEQNMKNHNFDNYVKLLDMKSHEALEVLKQENVKDRMLFVDGDHSYDGVKNDFFNFYDLVLEGGLIVFHDYNCTGVKTFTEELIEQKIISKYYSYGICFIVKK